MNLPRKRLEPWAGEQLRLDNYGGAASAAGTLIAPGTLDELRGLFERAGRDGRKVTLRGAGLAFDDQSLGDDLLLSMRGFGGIAIDPVGRTATVGGGASWGAIGEACMRHDLWPAVVVSTREVTAGGTLSANSYSRFSQTYGRESRWILGFKLLTPSGELLACSRAENADLFRAAIGGNGGLGAILEVTHQLIPLAGARQTRTRIHKTGTLEELVSYAIDVPACAGEAVVGIVVPGTELGIVLRSTYVMNQPGPPLRGLHSSDWWRIPFDLAGRFAPLSGRVWRLGHAWLLDPHQSYIDDLADFTFFMDPNIRARRFARRLGFRVELCQQSHLLPPDQTVAFLRMVKEVASSHGVQPILEDLLMVPADPDSLLSTGRDLSGFLVNVAFEPSSRTDLAGVEPCLRMLGRLCADLGGRVSLSKNVRADTLDLERMYGPQLDAFFALKRRVDPKGVLSSRFYERLFPMRMGSLAAN